MVCAAPGPGGAHYGGRARPGFDAARPVVCGGTADARVRVRTRAGTRLCGACAEGRFDTCVVKYTYVCVCVSVCVPRLHLHCRFICICENRSWLCMRVIVCDGDGSAVCARVGGLVLRARPETRNPSPCEPLPVGVDRVRLRRAGVLQGVGVQREHRRVEHRVRHLVVLCMRRSRPGGAHYGGRARPGFGAARGPLCAAAPPIRACVRTRASTRLRGGLGVGTAGRRGGSIRASLNLYIFVYASVCYTLAPTWCIYLYM